MKHALVTGGAGFIGSNLVDKLVDRGVKVEVWDCLSTGKKENVNPKATFRMVKCQADLFTHESFDVIFHLAAEARIQPSFHQPVMTCESNVIGTVNMLEFAKRMNAKFVYAGSSSFYHDPYVNPYSWSKWIGEEACKMYHTVWGTKCSIARFFNVYGPRHLETGAYATVIGIFERQKRNNEALTITGNGEQRRDFTHVFDIVDGLVGMAEHDSGSCDIFNLGTGRNYSINELAQLFRPDSVEYLPKRPGEADVTLADASLARERFGWEAKIKLEDYVNNFVQALDNSPT